MAGAKKFGTFAGVFTPSILTILGVIMYMRLGWVVGQAGLIATIAIVLIAHIISFTTSLSISSIATDKKIKTGGIYYILSRSLGLPMGGSIGITLFVGTALSIALYIVGFTENFLGIEAISNFLGMENDINSIRIIGSLVLLTLVAIAFISTSLAIKSQFFVLGAIALSLISIGLGFAFIDTSSIAVPVMSASDTGVPLITVFAIFFPAVTGFTAGVAMSGDLKDPKSSIPKGTMWAVITGLIVYISLSTSIAYFVDRETLLTDNNFFLKIALYSPLVIAGIWGATLSSALGGILGAPRIIQAISNDKIIPSFLGKGHGESNEPRNALIFTFVIAELGVLVGELDAIAEVVSMFYIAAYGFINLAFALESWASTDFRPSFAVNKWIGIIGFIASFGVMMQLNPGAMFAAFIIMWIIYFLLKRKEIKSDFGDVWGSVWSSLVRTSITKLSEKSLEKRNWKPNILLFSGENTQRPHLFDIGKKFIGKYGFLSVFDLKIKTNNDNFHFTKEQQNIFSKEQANGIFVRQHSVSNIYDGIEQIASTYGFAGVEPNTIFMGWARNTTDPKRSAQMVRNLYSLDLNVVMMDYDQELKFGDKKQIDVWWRGKGQNGNLSLQLIKFLQESDEWSKAKLRLMVVNPVNDDHENLYRQAKEILNFLRIDGDVRIINNQIEKRSFYDIINSESINSSLIFLGLPDIAEGNEEEFINNTNDLCHKIGTVVLVRASSQFMNLEIGKRKDIKTKTSNKLINTARDIHREIFYPKYENLKNSNANFFNRLKINENELNRKYISKLIEQENSTTLAFSSIINDTIAELKLAINDSKAEHITSKISAIQTKTFTSLNKLLIDSKSKLFTEQKIIINSILEKEIKDLKQTYNSVPKYISIKYSIDDMHKNANDCFDTKLYKWWNRKLNSFGKKEFNYKINYKHLLVEKLLSKHINHIEELMLRLGNMSSENITDTESFITNLDKEFYSIYHLASNNANKKDIIQELNNIENHISTLIIGIDTRLNEYTSDRESVIYQITNKLNIISSQIDVNSSLDEEYNINKAIKNISIKYDNVADKRNRNQNYLVNRVKLNIILLVFASQLRQFTSLILKRVKLYLEKDIIIKQEAYLNYLKSYKARFDKDSTTVFEYQSEELIESFNQGSADSLINLLYRTQKNILKPLPETIEIFSEESDNLIGTEKQFGELETIRISVIRLIDFMIQNEFTSRIQEVISKLPEQISERSHYLQDHLRFISYSIDNKDTINKDFSTFIDDEIKTIENNNELNNSFVNEQLLQIEERQRVINEKVSLYPFVQVAMNLKQYIRQNENPNNKNKIITLRDNIKLRAQNIAANLWYNESEGIILTKNILNDKDSEYEVKSKLRKEIAKLKAPKVVSDNLPYYYQQLFTNRHNYISDFWIPRPEAEAEFDNFIDDRNAGLAKALLIKGLPGTGKSHLSYRFVNNINKTAKPISIIPPIGGSIDIETFNKVLRTSFDVRNIEDINDLTGDFVLIFEDIELWWQKSADGFIVFDEIFNFINKYSDKFTILVIINSYTYSIIEKLRDTKRIFSHIINLNVIDARVIEQMIWKRHQSGGLKIKLGNKSEDNFHLWDYARLFNRYFKSSKGHINTAMYNWINNITEIEDKSIVIRRPMVLNSSIFNKLNDNELWILQSIIIHKQQSIKNISLITNFDIEFINRKMIEFQRIGIIEEKDKNIYEISPLIMPYLLQILNSKSYI